MLRYWKEINKPSSEPELEIFVVIKGNRKIYPKISHMIRETKHQFSVVSSIIEIMRANQYGVLDNAFNHRLRSKVQFRLLTDITKKNLSLVKVSLRQMPKTGFNFKGRNPSRGLPLFPRMAIRDEEEILYFIKGADSPEGDDENTCLWTNCKSLVQSFTVIFEELWLKSTDIQAKILEIENGKLHSPTIFSHKEMA
ncbi:MAG: HTH-type transcriptional regulator, sugar sensing transcriptional regulator [Thermoproteota archaeon]|nr:HTH-type transcriptional regulator, sugar sensing transcriptional regulator [Thermoproteota archaeon]